MSEPEHVEVLILGSGQGGKHLAWHMARAGRRTATVERRWVGGSCPNIACLPSKNELWSAKVVHLVRNAAQFGLEGAAAGGPEAGGEIGLHSTFAGWTHCGRSVSSGNQFRNRPLSVDLYDHLGIVQF